MGFAAYWNNLHEAGFLGYLMQEMHRCSVPIFAEAFIPWVCLANLGKSNQIQHPSVVEPLTTEFKSVPFPESVPWMMQAQHTLANEAGICVTVVRTQHCSCNLMRLIFFFTFLLFFCTYLLPTIASASFKCLRPVGALSALLIIKVLHRKGMFPILGEGSVKSCELGLN